MAQSDKATKFIKDDQPDQAQGKGLASSQQMTRGKDLPNPLAWMEALPKVPKTHKMVVTQSLWDRYKMGDPTVGLLSDEAKY